MSHVAPMRALNRPRPAVSVERRPDVTFLAERRAADVARLYAEPVDPQAIVAGGNA